ncbi:hypothetical protein [Acidovorax sp.]|uniref:hypothetical protein n=1 Tax=Acidovorax sp. TaxID=1872122 RepID=UPI002ACD8514|nr:hypothetical protein [Acidovorax sp.]MDZ7863047.1 hypothetical protein [Acidovorax sp.]
MRLSPAHAILHSRVGRQLLATFFVLVAVPVGAMSLLAYQLTEYVVQQSAAQLSGELAKAVGINLVDRLRAAAKPAEWCTRLPSGQGPGPIVLDWISRLKSVFASVDRLFPSELAPMPPVPLSSIARG